MNCARWLLILQVTSLVACSVSDETYMVGTLERDRVEVRVESNEPIIAIHVTDGQVLDAGDLILEQDSSRLEAALAKQMALRDQSAARLAELQRGPREEYIRTAQAELEATQAIVVNATASLERAREMFARDLSNQATLDSATANWKTAVAAEKAAGEALESLLNGTTVEELQQAQAALKAMDAGVEQIQLDIERLKIYAPVSGMLDKRLYQIGERPLPGATVAVILDASRTYARIYVPEHQRVSVQPGQTLDVRIDGHDRTMTGTVRWVSADASFTPYFALTEHDRSRLSYLSEVDLPDAADLPSGVPLQVDFPVAESGND
jgi:HlyD family secretion protein